MNSLIGKVIKSVSLAKDRKAIKFELEGGGEVIARADGECCSSSWIEEIQGVEQIQGSRIVAVERIDMPDVEYDKKAFEVLTFYGCKITSERGYCVIDYRNDSNGYYGGSLKWDENIFAEEWEPVG